MSQTPHPAQGARESADLRAKAVWKSSSAGAKNSGRLPSFWPHAATPSARRHYAEYRPWRAPDAGGNVGDLPIARKGTSIVSQDTPPSIAGTSGYPAASREAAAARCERVSKGVSSRPLIGSTVIPKRAGRAFRVAEGQVLRVRCHEGPQVADLIAFNADDPREKFWQARTRVIHGGHLGVGDQLWSIPPWTRPMMTLITDTVAHEALADGARSHDLLFCRCDARLYALVHKRTDAAPNCNDNLVDAIAPFGLGPGDVHDPFNIFMTTGLNASGKPFYLPSDAKAGDYVDLLAEMDVLVAISACPGGSSGKESLPLEVDIFGRE